MDKTDKFRSLESFYENIVKSGKKGKNKEIWVYRKRFKRLKRVSQWFSMAQIIDLYSYLLVIRFM